jgi:nucleotide-binding universal stress UspA family protein
MSEKPQRMSSIRHIVCAVRGSPQSRETVTHAIDLALETGARLTFFYAVDVEFLARATSRGPLSVVYRELIEMSEFTMLILRDRAERRGVAQVDSVIREGDVRTQLLDLVHEVQPDLLILGWPLRGSGRPRFKPAEFKAFVGELEQEGKGRVEVVPAPED